MKKIAIVGAFPPPVHGMAKNNLLISEELAKSVTVLKLNTSGSSLQRGAKYHLTRAIRSLKNVLSIILAKPSTVYMSIDGGFGVFYNILIIITARLLTTKLVVHHRSFSYLNKQSFLVRLATFLGGRNCLHVFLCSCMRDKYMENYKNNFRSLLVSNAKHTPARELVDQISPTGKFVIGHLSNLSIEKGLKEVIAVYEQLKMETGIEVELLLAGPTENETSSNLLNSALRRHPAGIKYLGGLYGNEKSDFYKSISLFIFPTAYKNEAQPNVIFEALSHNIPVISTNRGCIIEDLSGSIAGVIFDHRSFVTEATAYIKKVASDPSLHTKLKLAAHDLMLNKHAKAELEHQQLISEILHDTY